MNENSRLRSGSIESQNNLEIRTRLEKLLLTLLIVVVVVGVALVIALASYYTGSISKEEELLYSNVCKTKGCIVTSAHFLQSMDITVDPCQDFYSFACGGWINSSSNIAGITSRFSLLNDRIDHRLKDILENPDNVTIPLHQQKTKKFFDSCMNLGHRQEMKDTPMLKDMEKLGGWPLLDEDWDDKKFNWTDTILGLNSMGYDFDFLLKISVMPDIKNVSNLMIVVHQPTLGMPNKLYYLLDPYLLAYETFITRIALRFESKLSLSEVKSQIKKAMKIEEKLAKHSFSKTEAKRITEQYNVMTLTELQKLAPQIPWKYWLKGLGVNIGDDERIIVPNLGVLRAVTDLLDSLKNSVEGRRTLANYLMYRMAISSSKYLTLAFIKADNDFQNAMKGTYLACPDLWKMCVQVTNDYFFFSLESAYARQYMPDGTRKNLGDLMRDMRDALNSEIKAARWMDAATRTRAMHKAKHIRSIIAYQDEIANDAILDNFFENVTIGLDFYQNVKEINRYYKHQIFDELHRTRKSFRWQDSQELLVANAYYSPLRNSITIPEGILQQGFYAFDKPNYINYGSLGMIVGHEMIHAFDVSGSMFDSHGNWKQWWDNSTWNEYNNRVQCFIDQYNNYIDHSINASVNGTRTVGENTADNAGLKTAYLAYKKFTRRVGREKLLPGLPYTQKQMFWIAFASVWCRKQSDHVKKVAIKNDVHSPAQFRVNGVLSNMAEFSRDFNCQETSPLNPKDKCALWT